MDTDILVYLQKVKSFLKTNEEASKYFIGDSDVDEFYKQLTIVSEKNFETNGQPELTKEQFELLRVAVLATAISKQRVFYSDDKLFLFLDDYPGICMN
ncbi:MAG: hypothetical protein RLZ10_1304 [Bacteroidota bacterium]|jgi:hypothetical protein